MASKIPKRHGQQKFDDFDDVFSSMEALNEATKFDDLNKGHDFFPELANKQKLAQGLKELAVTSELVNPAQFRVRNVQSVPKNSIMPNFNDLYQQIEQISGVKITPEEQRVPLYQRKSPDHQLSSSNSHKPRPPPGFEKLKISEDQKHEQLSPKNPPPEAVSKFEPVTEKVNEVANNIFFERFGVPITGIQSSQESSEEAWDCSISTT